MLDKLLILIRINPNGYIKNLNILKKKKHAIKEIIKNVDVSCIEDLCASVSGTCTIFSINVVVNEHAWTTTMGKQVSLLWSETIQGGHEHS